MNDTDMINMMAPNHLNSIKLTSESCSRCNGSGKELNHKEIGLYFKRKRMFLDMRLKELSNTLGYCTAYVSELENGDTYWSNKLIKEFETAFKILMK